MKELVISSIIEKNASKLGVDYFLKVRADLIYRVINEKNIKASMKIRNLLKVKQKRNYPR